MAEDRFHYLVAYDISDQKKWRKVYRLLLAWGSRLQYSIFRVKGSALAIEELRCKLVKIIDTDDRLMMIRLCGNCCNHISLDGPPIQPFELETPTHFLQ